MLFRKHIVSTRTLVQSTAVMVLLLMGVGVAFAANSGNPPILVPYTVQTVAGTPQYPPTGTSVIAGYGGDGGPAVPTLNSKGVVVPGGSLSSPYGVALDSAGNIYITDTNNDVIREVNAVTGVINTIAGVDPKGCAGTLCATHTSGCADGVPAIGNPIGGKLEGIAVDAYGNVYFVDNTTSSVLVIYRGGARVAAFISLEDPTSAPTPASVQVGYLYHIAGAVNIGTGGTTGSCAATTGNVDNGLAFSNTATIATPTAELHGPTYVTLDSAGNIYIADISNSTVRVINTQTTPQTFFQYTLQPGYMRTITNCNAALTTACPTNVTSQWGTGINGPVNAIVDNSQYKSAFADAYGNIYQLNGTGGGTGAPGIYGAVAYAGGAPLTNLLTVEVPTILGQYNPNPTGFVFPSGVIPTQPELPLTYGNSYDFMDDPALASSLPGNYTNIIASQPSSLDIRPTSIMADIFGTLWYLDNHYPELERIDQYTADSTGIIGSTHQRATASIAGLETAPASLTNPWYCVYGTAANPWTQGPQETDPEGDGCPAILGLLSGGNYIALGDGMGNIFMTDNGNQIVRELPLGNSFPATPVGTATPVTQAIQVHFDQSNIPIIGGQVADAGSIGYTTTSFAIVGPNGPVATPLSGYGSTSNDFTVNTTTPEFPMGAVINSGATAYGQNLTTTNFQMWPAAGSPVGTGLPTCTQLGLTSPDNSYDCLIYITFTPQAPGLRTAQLVATTKNGSQYSWQLSGLGTGGQLTIDGGQQQTFASTGLGGGANGVTAVAVAQNGNTYIADPDNNRIVVENSGNQTVLAVNGLSNPATLSKPMGVAVDAGGNIYISDTGNNRVLKVNAITGAAQVLGNYLWIPGATCDTPATAAADCPVASTNVNKAGQTWSTYTLATEPGAVVTPTTAPPQYTFNGPEGLAVDTMGNVYVADTGNATVVEITSNTSLGGAVPMLSYTGAPKFVKPVAVAVDTRGYVYVADQGNLSGEVVRIPPGGGDLQPPGGNPGSALGLSVLPLFGGQGINTPNGVAVDPAFNVYVSDGTGNAIWVAPAVGPPNGNPYVLNFSGLNAPAGLALDASGNLYVADSGNKQVVWQNRGTPLVSFGKVPEDLTSPAQPLCPNSVVSDGYNVGNSGSCALTVTNIGNSPFAFTPPFLSTSGTGFTVNTTCTSPIPVGSTCAITPTFLPTSAGPQSETLTIMATGQSAALTATTNATGANPLVNIVLSSSVGTSPAANSTAVISATVTQPHPPNIAPTGTVTFTYTIDAGTANAGLCGSGATATMPLNGSGVATYTIPNALAQGLQYTVTATYNGDANNTATVAAPLVLTVPGVAETVTAASSTYTYGSPVPAIVGTVTPTPPSPVTVTFTSNASQYSNIGVYPIQVVFKGGNFCSYGFPAAQTSGGQAATITETPVTLTVNFPQAFSTVYGAATFNYNSGLSISGAVGTDLQKISATFTPVDSSVLDVGSYPVVPTLTGKPVGNYTVKITNGVDNVTPAPSGITITPLLSSVLATSTVFTGATTSGSKTVNVANTSNLLVGESVSSPDAVPAGTTISAIGSGTTAGTITISNAATATIAADQITGGVPTATFQVIVTTQVTAGKGVPTGTVTVYDNFVPITPTVFYPVAANVPPAAAASVIPPCTGTQTTGCNPPIVVPLTAGIGTFNLPSAEVQLGIHYFSYLYGGDPSPAVVGGSDGKGDFQCSVLGQAATASCPTTGTAQTTLIVDNPDITLTSTTGPININPGTYPSTDGIPPAPGQNSAYPQVATLQVNVVLGFTGNVTLTCATQNPGYVSCFMLPTIVCFGSASICTPANTGTSQTVILGVYTPASLPLGYNFGTASIRTSATRTVLAFLPFGFLAFCVRRRRRLSKALWVLVTVVAVTAGVSGCGGNLTDFFTPIPTGPQTVTVTASSAAAGVSRSFVVPIAIN